MRVTVLLVAALVAGCGGAAPPTSPPPATSPPSSPPATSPPAATSPPPATSPTPGPSATAPPSTSPSPSRVKPTGIIAFVSVRAGPDDLWLMNADGSDQRAVTDDAAIDAMPALSPDGTRIAFISNRDHAAGELYVIGTDGTGLRRLTSNTMRDQAPSWSPDGKRIVFDGERGGDFEILVIPAAGGKEANISNNARFDSNPSWSPDGKLIAFVTDPDQTSAEIHVMRPDGTGLRKLTTSPDGQSSALEVDWSPDGSRLVLARNVGTTGNYDLWLSDLDGVLTRLTDTPVVERFPAWSPDGSLIAYATVVDGKLGIWVIGADGTDPHALIPAGGGDAFPSWVAAP